MENLDAASDSNIFRLDCPPWLFIRSEVETFRLNMVHSESLVLYPFWPWQLLWFVNILLLCFLNQLLKTTTALTEKKYPSRRSWVSRVTLVFSCTGNSSNSKRHQLQNDGNSSRRRLVIKLLKPSTKMLDPCQLYAWKNDPCQDLKSYFQQSFPKSRVLYQEKIPFWSLINSVIEEWSCLFNSADSSRQLPIAINGTTLCRCRYTLSLCVSLLQLRDVCPPKVPL